MHTNTQIIVSVCVSGCVCVCVCVCVHMCMCVCMHDKKLLGIAKSVSEQSARCSQDLPADL